MCVCKAKEKHLTVVLSEPSTDHNITTVGREGHDIQMICVVRSTTTQNVFAGKPCKTHLSAHENKTTVIMIRSEAVAHMSQESGLLLCKTGVLSFQK